MPVHVFVGPTLPPEEVLAITPDATIHPPVAHGDLLRLGFTERDVVVIVDGYYHQSGSVRHKEILALLAADIRVVGCSSMGALRAAELHPFGMVGHGVVYEMYRSGVVTADDEVAVTHSEPPRYRPLTEPLVNIRYALSTACSAGALTSAQADGILDLARGLHYTARSWQTIERVAESEVDSHDETCSSVESLAALRSYLDAHPADRDIKAVDAVDTLRRLPELLTVATSANCRAWTESADWRNRFLYDWEASFPGITVAGTHVEHAAVARYHQIYHPRFPARWRSYALTMIAESAGAGRRNTDDLQARALAAAEVMGVTATTLTPAQLRYWLTADEVRTLPAAERVVRVLTRSFRPRRLAFDLVTAAADFVDDAHSRTAVAESYAANARLAAERPGQSIHHLKAAVLQAHLAEVWGVGGNDDTLLAAARDRGLESVQAAVETLRPYFIRSHLQAVERAARAKVG